jgi:Xaa-Pro aminopeptidase
MMGHETHLRLPLGDFRRLEADLSGAAFLDATDIVHGLRRVKSEAEIVKLRHICGIASDAFARVPDLIRPGMADAEAFRAFRIACLEAGADEVPYLVGGAGPGGYGDIISPPSGRPLAAGDVMILDTGCSWDGYFCDFDRNFGLGPVTQTARDAHEILFDATEAGLAAARPGNSFADLHAAMAGNLPGGDAAVGRMGHGLGMQLTEQPSVAPFEKTALEPGMVLTLEPGYQYGDGLVMVHEEDIVIRDAAPELLSRRAPRALPAIG